jgi:hypothetical protein
LKGFLAFSPHEFLDGISSGHFCGDANRNRRVRDGDSRPGASPASRPGRRKRGRPEGSAPIPRAGDSRIAALGTWSARRLVTRRFDRAEWVITPPPDALRGGRPWPQPCNYNSGASRTSAFLTDTANSSAFRTPPSQSLNPLPCSPILPEHAGRYAPCDGRSADPRRRSGHCRRSAAEGRLPKRHCRRV